MEKSRLRRDRDKRARLVEEDRLAHLAVPGAEAQGLALVAAELKLVAAKIGGNGRGVERLCARRRLTDSAHGEPCGVVAVGHPAFGKTQEAVLQLRRTPFLMRPRPGGG